MSNRESRNRRKVSAYVIAYNEAEKLPETLASLSWVDEIVVADSYSTDETASIALAHGAKVVQITFSGFGALRNEAVMHCEHDWIFSLDSDERCTPEVAKEILCILGSEAPCDAYLVPRRNFFMGRWIRHSGWYPNFRQPQFFHRAALTYDNLPVHEGYILKEGAHLCRLNNAIWQIPFGDVGEVLRKADRYSSLGSTKITQPRITLFTALSHASWAFLKHYVFKLGFLDGSPGFVIAFGNFEGTFYRYLKAMETQASGWKK